jgi:DNA polymerase I
VNVINVQQARPTVMLLDMNNLLWRAAGATSMTNLTNSKGKITGHIYNFVKMMSNYWDRADMIIMVEDRKCLRRYELFPAYKGNRKEKNEGQEAVFNMVQELRDVVPLFPCHHAHAEGEEADDVMATLALKFKDRGYDVVIISSDKDLWQTIEPNIKVVTGSDRLVKGEMFDDKFNISQEMVKSHFVLSKALLGDKSDNIPSVAMRMMSKDLKRLLALCDGSIEDLLRVCRLDRSGTAKKIISNKATLELNYKLCSLRFDVDAIFTINEGNTGKLKEVLEEAECKSLIDEIGKFDYSPRNYDDLREVSINE